MEGEYVCAVCRNSPLVADAMMTSAGSSSLAPSPASVSSTSPQDEHDDATSRNDALEATGFSVQPDSPANRNTNSPLAISNIDSTFNDIFTIASSHTPGWLLFNCWANI
ncbi:unnamed protein product [Anisakis simplex]|uniref:Uncharacterized protein n=1 Tax=Anisakis simplex TaxID=6269 RepID=A0A3P6P8T4_ANISI|nr:unnamed protein product [Anisakis simplex]